MSRKIIETPDEIFISKKKWISMTDLLLVNIVIMIFWKGEKKLHPKMIKFGSKLKNIYGEGE